MPTRAAVMTRVARAAANPDSAAMTDRTASVTGLGRGTRLRPIHSHAASTRSRTCSVAA